MLDQWGDWTALSRACLGFAKHGYNLCSHMSPYEAGFDLLATLRRSPSSRACGGELMSSMIDYIRNDDEPD